MYIMPLAKAPFIHAVTTPHPPKHTTSVSCSQTKCLNPLAKNWESPHPPLKSGFPGVALGLKVMCAPQQFWSVTESIHF